MGLFVDIVSMQTLGVSSLVLLGVGYGAGRLREARDPEGTLVPLAAGARDAAVQRRLRAHAVPARRQRAGQLGAPAPDVATLVVNALIALPVYALVRRWLLRRAARGPAPPSPARLHDRRLVAAVALMMEPVSRSPAPDHAAARAAGGDLRRRRVRALRDRVLPPVVPAGAVGRQYLAQANSNRVRALPIPAPRGRIVDRKGKVIVQNEFAAVIEIDPSALPQSERDLAATGASGWASARRVPRAIAASPIRSREIPDAELRARLKRLGRVLNTSANSIHRQIVRSLVLVPYSNVRAEDRRAAVDARLHLGAPEQFPGVKVEQAYLRDYPHGELAAQILGYVGQIGPAKLKQKRYQGVKQGTVVGQDGLERTYDKYLRGAARRAARAGRRQRPADPQPAPEGLKAGVRPAPAAVAGSRPARRRARRRSPAR